MKISFVEDLHLNKANIIRLEIINKIIDEYSAEGYKLTLRQLYYQLVSRDIIPNNLREYAKLSGLLVKGRMAGVVDWDAIEDRIRRPFLPYWIAGIKAAIEDTIDQYRLDRQKGQDVYIEVWVEKDALSGVLKRITSYFHVNLMVNRGYSSCTAMHDAYERFQKQIDAEKKVVILYLGDHDPSGLDMIRDIRERLQEFGLNFFESEEETEGFTIKQIGLTTEQVKKYNPPPNPAKFTDPRANWYIEQFGKTCWEVDALNPKILHQLVTSNIQSLIDMDKFNSIIKQEETDKKRMGKLVKK